MSLVRSTARALMEQARGTGVVNEARLYGPAHYTHLAKLLAQAKNHLPPDKWEVLHKFVSTALTSDNPGFDPGQLTAG
jgi:hypothetical protein